MIEVQSSVYPFRQQQMLGFQPSRPGMLVAGDGQNIAVVNHAQLRALRHIEQFARDIGISDALLLPRFDSSIVFFVSHLVDEMLVSRHIRGADVHQSHEGKRGLVGAYSLHESFVDSRLHHLGEIMVAGSKRDDAILVVYPSVVVDQVGIGPSVVSVAEGQRQHVFHHRGTVNATQIDRKVLLFVKRPEDEP